jgi:hypothetical protein
MPSSKGCFNPLRIGGTGSLCLSPKKTCHRSNTEVAMEKNEVKQRIAQIKSSADRAIEACRSDGNVPDTLKDCITQFDEEINNAVTTVDQADDEDELIQCIDDLEETADRAKREAQRAGDISEQTRAMVMRAHDEVSALKHQLH